MKQLPICLLVGLITSLTACQPTNTPTALGTIERDRIELAAEAYEPVTEIWVREGDHVVVDQALLRQSVGAMQPRLDQAQAQLHKAEQQLRELQNGPRIQEIARARAQLESANSAFNTAELEFKRAQQLVEVRAQSQALLDQLRSTRDAALSQQQQAQLNLQLLNQGTRVEQLDQAKASVEAARAALAELQLSATRYVVKATRAGVIEALPYKLGERPAIGQPLVILLADDRTYARVYIPEPLRTQYAAGSAVQVQVDGVAQSMTGTVRYVSAQAAFTPYYALTQTDRTRLSYLAEIDLPSAQSLPVGIPVEVRR